MKKIIIFISIIVSAQTLTSQVCGPVSSGTCVLTNTVQIGNGTASNNNNSYPAIYGNWYKNARHQILYPAAELLAAGLQMGEISSIGFYISAVAGTTVYPDFTISMKCTSASDLSSTTFDNSGLTQVYFTPTTTITSGLNSYNFPTAYEWDGISNILIDVCTSITANYSYNSSVPYTITPYVSVRWMNSDIASACSTTNIANSYNPNNTYRPNIVLGNCATIASLNSAPASPNSVCVFPNPSTGIFNIRNATNKMEISIMNVIGQIVKTMEIKNANQAAIDMSHESKGVYYAKIITNEETQLFKLILE